MEGQGRNIVTIYEPSAMATGSREGLADNISGNAYMGSTGSIPVTREQYCMCAPGTPLEKKLVIIVVALAVVVIALLVIIVILAARDMKSEQIVQALAPRF